MKVGDKLIRIIDGEEGIITRRTVHRLEVKLSYGSMVKKKFSNIDWGIEDTGFKYPEEEVKKIEEPKPIDKQELSKAINILWNDDRVGYFDAFITLVNILVEKDLANPDCLKRK